MIDFIQGKVINRSKGRVVIEQGGFGIEVITPDNLHLEGKVRLYTYLVIKDEEPKLYGFGTREDRDFFLKLISVSGIGIKHAIALLSKFSSDEIIQAIENSDISVLSSVSGIGTKTAKRIIFELKGKLDFYTDELIEDVVQALVNLGFDKKESLKTAVEVTKTTKNIEEAIKLALQKLYEKR
ncbi:MAG: Holliday junction branch migration protein RuvA [Aquificae bacterium]|nr:Holliday junction branch migration protein RuvA [Aquificota bacterium]